MRHLTNNNLIKSGIRLQNSDLSHPVGKAVLALFKHLVQGSLIILGGAAVYGVAEIYPAIEPVSYGVGFIAMLVLAKVFYASGAVAATKAGAAVATYSAHQTFTDGDSDKGWHEWHGSGLDDNLIKDKDI